MIDILLNIMGGKSPKMQTGGRLKLNDPDTTLSFNMDKALGINIPTFSTESKIPFINIKDNRKINPVTNQPINSNRDLKTGKYDSLLIDAIIRQAKKDTIDPYEALAVGMQETGLHPIETGHVRDYSHIGLGANEEDMNKMSPEEKEAFLLVGALKDKINYGKKLGYKDKLHQLQAYNGYGKIWADTEKNYYGHENNSFYGVDVTKFPIDTKKNPVYGKTIVSLAKMLKSNPNIENMVDPSAKYTQRPIKIDMKYNILPIDNTKIYK